METGKRIPMVLLMRVTVSTIPDGLRIPLSFFRRMQENIIREAGRRMRMVSWYTDPSMKEIKRPWNGWHSGMQMDGFFRRPPQPVHGMQ